MLPSSSKKAPTMKKQRAAAAAAPPATRTLEFCIISAQGLKNVHKFGMRMRTYAVAYVCSPPYATRRSPYGGRGAARRPAFSSATAPYAAATRVDEEGGANPTWDEVVQLEVEEAAVSAEEVRAQLSIDIYSRASWLRDKLVGSVRILLCDAAATARDRPAVAGGQPGQRGGGRRLVNRFPVTSYLVFRPSGDPHGILNVCIPPGGRFPDRLDSISFKHDVEIAHLLGCDDDDDDDEDDERRLAAPPGSAAAAPASQEPAATAAAAAAAADETDEAYSEEDLEDDDSTEESSPQVAVDHRRG